VKAAARDGTFHTTDGRLGVI